MRAEECCLHDCDLNARLCTVSQLPPCPLVVLKQTVRLRVAAWTLLRLRAMSAAEPYLTRANLRAKVQPAGVGAYYELLTDSAGTSPA